MNDHARPSFPSRPDQSGFLLAPPTSVSADEATPWYAAADPTAVPSIFGGLSSARHTTLAELVVAAAAGLAEHGESDRVDGGGEIEPPVDLADYAARRRRAASSAAPARSRARCR